jgi:hypothetical protein
LDPDLDQRADTLSEILKQGVAGHAGDRLVEAHVGGTEGTVVAVNMRLHSSQLSCCSAMSLGFEVDLGASLFKICDCLLLKSCESDHLDPSQPRHGQDRRGVTPRADPARSHPLQLMILVRP